MNGQDLTTDVLRELRITGAADAPSAEDTEYVLGKMNRLIDSWNAERAAVHADVLSTFTLVPGTQPHTIGPAASSPTWIATQRPVRILAANLILTAGTRLPIEIIGPEDWMTLADPTLTGDPWVVWYSPEWPLGKLYFYFAPSAAYQVELLSRVLLSAFDLTTEITLAPGYRDAIVLTTAEHCARAFTQQDAPASLVIEARAARARIFANNDRLPTLDTRDEGLPCGSGGGSGRFDYQSGTSR